MKENRKNGNLVYKLFKEKKFCGQEKGIFHFREAPPNGSVPCVKPLYEDVNAFRVKILDVRSWT